MVGRPVASAFPLVVVGLPVTPAGRPAVSGRPAVAGVPWPACVGADACPMPAPCCAWTSTVLTTRKSADAPIVPAVKKNLRFMDPSFLFGGRANADTRHMKVRLKPDPTERPATCRIGRCPDSQAGSASMACAVESFHLARVRWQADLEWLRGRCLRRARDPHGLQLPRRPLPAHRDPA